MPAQINTAKPKFEIKMGPSTREAFGRTVVELGRENKDVVVVDRAVDQAGLCRTRDRHHERFIGPADLADPEHLGSAHRG